jgi:L-aminopeptidase/D-esterase-like protein
VAQMARNGMAQVIRPLNTMFDGDIIFALALGPRTQRLLDPTAAAVQVNTLGAVAATTLVRAIIKAVRSATDLHGVPAVKK